VVLDVVILGGHRLINKKSATTLHEGEADVSREFAKVAKRVVVVADSTKMMKSTFARICPLDQIDVLVTDEPQSPAFAEDLAGASVRVIVAL